jgi:hypothetical protein
MAKRAVEPVLPILLLPLELLVPQLTASIALPVKNKAMMNFALMNFFMQLRISFMTPEGCYLNQFPWC